MKDYYKILGIDKNSSIQEIKRSFRKRAKELHPDLRNRGPAVYSGTAQDEDMKILLKAYKVLSDPEKRRDYDRIYFYFKASQKIRFDYREFLRKRKGDFFSQSKLILYDLLHSNPEEATALYAQLTEKLNFRLDLYLSWEDYMDCIFLLAEQYEAEGNYLKAYELFKMVYLEEMRKPYFRHFIEEVAVKIKHLVCYQLFHKIPPNLNIQFLQELLSFDFPRKDKALFYKRMAEIYSHIGERERAIKSLQMGLRYNHRLSGIKKLKEKIDYPEICIS